MTEYDLFAECLPMIAEMAVRCRKLSRQEYENWKRETMEYAPETVKTLLSKVLISIDLVVLN